MKGYVKMKELRKEYKILLGVAAGVAAAGFAFAAYKSLKALRKAKAEISEKESDGDDGIASPDEAVYVDAEYIRIGNGDDSEAPASDGDDVSENAPEKASGNAPVKEDEPSPERNVPSEAAPETAEGRE